jgi:protein dithiol:quinone oxidoreductase
MTAPHEGSPGSVKESASHQIEYPLKSSVLLCVFLLKASSMSLRFFLPAAWRLFDRPRYLFVGLALVPCLLLCFGLYLQHIEGLEPCPMCIVQRYVMSLMVLVALVFSWSEAKGAHRAGFFLFAGLGLSGAYVAARQSWLQWYPPEVVSCGRDFYGMIETFPLKRAIPMIFKGGGDCSQVDWTFLGGSIANWSFVAFVALAFVALVGMYRSFSPCPVSLSSPDPGPIDKP